MKKGKEAEDRDKSDREVVGKERGEDDRRKEEKKEKGS